MTTQLRDTGATLTRREFLGATGGLALGFVIGPNLLLRVFDAHADAGGLGANAWVHIATDGTISIMLPSSEMGQGIMTSLPLLLA